MKDGCPDDPATAPLRFGSPGSSPGGSRSIPGGSQSTPTPITHHPPLAARRSVPKGRRPAAHRRRPIPPPPFPFFKGCLTKRGGPGGKHVTGPRWQTDLLSEGSLGSLEWSWVHFGGSSSRPGAVLGPFQRICLLICPSSLATNAIFMVTLSPKHVFLDSRCQKHGISITNA